MPFFNGDLKWHTTPCSAIYLKVLSIKKIHGSYNSKLLAIGKSKSGCTDFKSEDVICLSERSNEECLFPEVPFIVNLIWYYSA